MELQAVFSGYISVKSAYKVLIDGVETRLIWQCGLRLIVYVGHLEHVELGQRHCYHITAVVHTRTMGLYHSCFAINIHNQSGQEVAFAMHQPVGIIVGAVEAKRATQCQCLGESTCEKVLIDYRVAKVEDTHRNATYLVMPHPYKAMVGTLYGYHIPLLYALGHGGNSARKHPRMKTVERLFLAASQCYHCSSVHSYIIVIYLKIKR